jgi:hypothetical protein
MPDRAGRLQRQCVMRPKPRLELVGVTLGIKTKGGVRGNEGGGPSAGAALPPGAFAWDFFC